MLTSKLSQILLLLLIVSLMVNGLIHAQIKYSDHSIIMKQVIIQIKDIKKNIPKKTKLDVSGVLSEANIQHVTEIVEYMLRVKYVNPQIQKLLELLKIQMKTYKSKPFSPDEQKIIIQVNKELKSAKSYKEMEAIIEKWQNEKLVKESKLLISALNDQSMCLKEEIRLGENPNSIPGDDPNGMCLLPGWVKSALIIAGSDLLGAGVGGPLGAAGASIIAAAEQL